MEILCIGHAAYDLTIPLEEYPKENDKYSIDQFLEAGGGPAANAAYLLSKWGVKTGFIGLIGDDVYGRRHMEEFKEVGVDVSLLPVERDYPIPFSTILVNKKNASRTIINRKVPHKELEIDKKELAKINPKVVLLDGHEIKTSLLALELFPNAISILDAGSLREGTRLLSTKVDYVVASEKFAKEYTNLDKLEKQEDYKKCIDKLKKLSKGQVVVTLGERGLIYEKDGQVFKQEAFPAKAIDTTGAGDIFHGAFAYGVVKKLSLEENLKFSSATSSLSVTKLGGRQSIPGLKDVKLKIEEENKKNQQR